MNLCQKVLDWLEERYALEQWLKWAGQKTVPKHKHSIWYYFGGVIVFLFAVQFVTGIVLFLYYKPTPEAAHKSVETIMTEAPMGWLVRSVHSYSAQILVGLVLIHFFSTLLLKAYRKPREFTWVKGILLLGVTFFFCFSGYLLPWDDRAFSATKVGTDLFRAIPGGGLITALARGGADVSGETLIRFFALHVCALPLAFLFLLGIHLLLIQRQGMSVPLSVESDPKRLGKVRHLPFLPNVMLRDAIIWLVTLGLVVTLSALWPWPLGEEAKPLAPTPDVTKPEWYLLFAFQFVKLFPSRILFLSGEFVAVSLMIAAGAFFVLIPFLDRRAAHNRKSPVFTAVGVGSIVIFIILTVIGWQS